MCSGELAQMVERSLSMREVPGSMPGFSNTSLLSTFSHLLINQVIYNVYVFVFILFCFICLCIYSFIHLFTYTFMFLSVHSDVYQYLSKSFKHGARTIHVPCLLIVHKIYAQCQTNIDCMKLSLILNSRE